MFQPENWSFRGNENLIVFFQTLVEYCPPDESQPYFLICVIGSGFTALQGNAPDFPNLLSRVFSK